MTTITVTTQIGDIDVELVPMPSGSWTNGGKTYDIVIDGEHYGSVEHIREESWRAWDGKWQGGAHWSARAVFGKKPLGKFHKCDKCDAAGEILCTTVNRVTSNIHTTRRQAVTVMAQYYASAVTYHRL